MLQWKLILKYSSLLKVDISFQYTTRIIICLLVYTNNMFQWHQLFLVACTFATIHIYLLRQSALSAALHYAQSALFSCIGFLLYCNYPFIVAVLVFCRITTSAKQFMKSVNCSKPGYTSIICIKLNIFLII